MKFQKVMTINISKSALEPDTWSKTNQLTDTLVSLEKDSPNITSELADTDCLLVNFGTDVTKEMIDSAASLKYIGVLATAFGKVDIEYAKSKGIPVTNLAGYSTDSVAEFTIAAILEQIRGLEIGKQRGRSNNYSEDGINAREIKNSTFGIIGLGTIGNRVGELAHGFGAHVVYSSRSDKKSPFASYQDIDDILTKSDFISINLAQTSETEEFFNKEKFNKIKKDAVVINTSPMELIDIDALVGRLKRKDLVFILDHSDEMSKEDLEKLASYQNCIIYPPLAYITREASEAKQKMFLNNMTSFLEGSTMNVVNS